MTVFPHLCPTFNLLRNHCKIVASYRHTPCGSYLSSFFTAVGVYSGVLSPQPRMFGRNDGVIVRAEVIAERRRGVRLGRVDHDGAPIRSPIASRSRTRTPSFVPSFSNTAVRGKIGSRISSVGRGRPMPPAICVPKGSLMSISANPASRCSEAVTAFPRAGAGIRWRLCRVIPLPAGARCNHSVSDRIGWAEHHGWSGSDALPHAPRAR